MLHPVNELIIPKDEIKQDRDALKAAQTEKEAKAVIEEFSYTK
jgi:hypothetical protein